MSRPEPRPRTLSQALAGSLADSVFFREGRRLWEANSKNWNFRLTQFQKLLCGGYLILKDYSAGIFPPKFPDRASTFQGEIDYNASAPGVSVEEVRKSQATKPFWDARSARFYLSQFQDLHAALQRYNIQPGQRLLELGCGAGWMSEFLCIGGYSVVGTSIAPDDIEVARKKIPSIQAKGLPSNLEFVVSPMESIHEIPQCAQPFDAAFIFEALHHAYSWKETFRSVHKTLKPGGWFLIANEPNLLHTFISYRVARLSNTHEIGMSKRALARELREIGFRRVDVIAPRFENFVSHIWIMAQK